MKHKINSVFEQFSLQKYVIRSNIRRCISAVLDQEGITVPCEINVLVTNDEGIHVINKTSRDIDRATDVLSFPMFQLEAGSPPKDWEEYLIQIFSFKIYSTHKIDFLNFFNHFS